MKEQLAEVEAIVNNAEPATFENTILPYDKSGQTLNRVSNVFFNLNECLTNDEMVAIAEQVLPMLSKHSDSIMMNPTTSKSAWWRNTIRTSCAMAPVFLPTSKLN